MTKYRAFMEVSDKHKKYGKVIKAYGEEHLVFPSTKLPVRADKGAAGYDLFTPIDITINPGDKVVVWTNVKAYMQADEVLQIFVRSSIGIKDNVTLANGTGIIDVSYFENPSNDGNIGICLKNNSGQGKTYSAGTRIAQGVFTKYLTVDDEEVLSETRTGGIGSSGQ